MFDAEGAAERVPAEPDVWTDGRLRIRSLVLLRQVRFFYLSYWSSLGRS